MWRLALRRSIWRKILIVVASVLPFAWVQTPGVLAQHAGGHVGGGVRAAGRPVAAAPAPHAPISRPRVFLSASPARASNFSSGFRRRPIFFPRRPILLAVPSFGFNEGWQLGSPWWLTCGPLGNQRLGCNGLPLDENNVENYVTRPIYEERPVYGYGGGAPDLVQLYLKDGEVYPVSDYWFVGDQVHFTLLEADGTKSEQTFSRDELDLQKTVDVNTRRGFRFVMRNEPWEQYLRDHPDLTPPLATPQPNN